MPAPLPPRGEAGHLRLRCLEKPALPRHRPAYIIIPVVVEKDDNIF